MVHPKDIRIGDSVLFTNGSKHEEGIVIDAKENNGSGYYDISIFSTPFNHAEGYSLYYNPITSSSELSFLDVIENLHFLTFQETQTLLLDEEDVFVLGFIKEYTPGNPDKNEVTATGQSFFVKKGNRILMFNIPTFRACTVNYRLTHVMVRSITAKKFEEIISQDFLNYFDINRTYKCTPLKEIELRRYLNHTSYSKLKTTERGTLSGIKLGPIAMWDYPDLKFYYDWRSDCCLPL